jgi:hypothetical protein
MMNIRKNLIYYEIYKVIEIILEEGNIRFF